MRKWTIFFALLSQTTSLVEISAQIVEHRMQDAQQLQSLFVDVPMRLAEYRESLARRLLRFTGPDLRENIAKN